LNVEKGENVDKMSENGKFISYRDIFFPMPRCFRLDITGDILSFCFFFLRVSG